MGNMMDEIYIRKTESSDYQSLKEIYESSRVYPNSGHLPHPKISFWEQRYASIPDNVHAYVAVNKVNENEEVVGHLDLTVYERMRFRHVAKFGMAVKKGQQGKGIGNALMQTMINLADNWLNLHRIELTVYTDNEPAIALYKKFGFAIEGEAVDCAYRNGDYVNAYYMSRIKK